MDDFWSDAEHLSDDRIHLVVPRVRQLGAGGEGKEKWARSKQTCAKLATVVDREMCLRLPCAHWVRLRLSRQAVHHKNARRTSLTMSFHRPASCSLSPAVELPCTNLDLFLC